MTEPTSEHPQQHGISTHSPDTSGGTSNRETQTSAQKNTVSRRVEIAHLHSPQVLNAVRSGASLTWGRPKETVASCTKCQGMVPIGATRCQACGYAPVHRGDAIILGVVLIGISLVLAGLGLFGFPLMLTMLLIHRSRDRKPRTAHA